MKIAFPLVAFVILLAFWLRQSPGSTSDSRETLDSESFRSDDPKNKTLGSSLLRTNPQVHQDPVTLDLLRQFSLDLIELYESPDGRRFRFDQQHRKVDDLLIRGEKAPVDGLDLILSQSGTLLPMDSLDLFQALGLREMDFIRNSILHHAGVLRKLEAGLLTHGHAREDGTIHETASLQQKIRNAPLGYPPEVIFLAFSPSGAFPSDNDAFLYALASSRDRGLLGAASSWMEYTAWRGSAEWLTSFPEYESVDFSYETIKSVPQVASAFRAYSEAEQQYLFFILSDMAAFGYLE